VIFGTQTQGVARGLALGYRLSGFPPSSDFGATSGESENYFVGRLPGVVTTFQPRADFLCPVGAIQFRL